MNSVIRFGAVVSLGIGLVLTSACEKQTVPEKAEVVKNDVVRAAKKAAHRTEELVCLDSDAECLAKKAKNRVTEAKDAAVDKADELKDKLDD